MNYTLIAYKPNSDDYCRGCHMASYSSDFELFCTNDEQELLDKWFDIKKRKRAFDTGEEGYEITILFNGRNPAEDSYEGQYEEYEHLIHFRELIDERFAQWSKEQDEEDVREKLRKEQKRKKRERQQDLRQLAELKKKLGDHND